VIQQAVGPTVLVGHSYGGAVITNAGAELSNVIGLVFCDAFAPDVGESMLAPLATTATPAAPSAAYSRNFLREELDILSAFSFVSTVTIIHTEFLGRFQILKRTMSQCSITLIPVYHRYPRCLMR